MAGRTLLEEGLAAFFDAQYKGEPLDRCLPGPGR